MPQYTIPVLGLTALLLLGAFTAEMAKTRYSFAGGEGISIEGTSNVHGWSCATSTVTGTFVAPPDAPLAAVEQLRVEIPVDPLACGNREMDRRMKRALNSEQHRAVRYELEFLSVASQSGDRATLNSRGRLTINGVTKPVTMQVNGQVRPDGRIHFTGSQNLQMSDFGIDPPSAMLGAMRTGDRVTVKFDVLAVRQ